MKNLIAIIILTWSALSVIAQTRVTDISQAPLKGKVKCVTTYIFRADNHEVPDTTGSAEKTVETFDKKGWELEEKNYDKNGVLQARFSFEYIGDSIVVKNQFDKNGKLFVKYTFRYDSLGKETEFDMNSDAQPKFRLAKVDYRCLYEYDKSGNIITESQYIDKDRLSMRTVSKYNDQKRKIQSDNEMFLGKIIKASKTVYFYDDAGNMLKSETYDADGKLSARNIGSCERVDKYGNWLLSTSSYSSHSIMQGDFTFTHVATRVIEYY